jgi:hypothetical protein
MRCHHESKNIGIIVLISVSCVLPDREDPRIDRICKLYREAGEIETAEDARRQKVINDSVVPGISPKRIQESPPMSGRLLHSVCLKIIIMPHRLPIDKSEWYDINWLKNMVPV